MGGEGGRDGEGSGAEGCGRLWRGAEWEGLWRGKGELYDDFI